MHRAYASRGQRSRPVVLAFFSVVASSPNLSTFVIPPHRKSYGLQSYNIYPRPPSTFPLFCHYYLYHAIHQNSSNTIRQGQLAPPDFFVLTSNASG